jgi:hypothetical protein
VYDVNGVGTLWGSTQQGRSGGPLRGEVLGVN